MYGKSTLATAAAVVLPLAAAQLEGSTVIDPPISYDQIDSILGAQLTPPQYTLTAWDGDRADLIPQGCVDMISGEEGINAVDMEVFDIAYADCETPWIACRHKDAVTTQQDLADTFGKLPVRSRQYVRHLLAVPGAASAGTNNNNILFRDNTATVSVYMHETAHSLDSTGFDNYPNGFSIESVWTDAYEADGRVVASDYSRSSQAENLAQMIVIAHFDQNVEGGIGSIASNWQEQQNQLAAVNNNIGDELTTGGTCTKRLEQSEAVSKNGAVGRLMRFVKNAPMPDLSIAPGIEIMEGGVFSFEDKFY